MEIYVPCITLLAVVAIVAVLLVAWRRPERKVMAMLAELVRDSHERLTAPGVMRERRLRRPLPPQFPAGLAEQLGAGQPAKARSMADELDAQTEAENAPAADQPREAAVF
jgi:hypothetical protein